MEYSKTHCHFCNQPLVEQDKKKSLSCPDRKCKFTYHYLVDNSAVRFVIKDYWFQIYPDGEIFIVEAHKAQFKSKITLDITPHNYLEQIERIKKLQVFS